MVPKGRVGKRVEFDGKGEDVDMDDVKTTQAKPEPATRDDDVITHTDTPIEQDGGSTDQPVAKKGVSRRVKKTEDKPEDKADDDEDGMIVVRGRVGDGQIALFDVSNNHPGGQVTIYGKAEKKVWPTVGVSRALNQGRVERV